VEALRATRLHDRGVTERCCGGLARSLRDRRSFIARYVLDAGCGDGFYLGSLARETGCDAHGWISRFPRGCGRAALPGVEWIVANADRFVLMRTVHSRSCFRLRPHECGGIPAGAGR